MWRDYISKILNFLKKNVFISYIKSFLKKTIRAVLIFLFCCLMYKVYFYFFTFIYFLKYGLLYNVNNFLVILVYAIISIYFSYCLHILIEPKHSTMFFFTINFACFIYYLKIFSIRTIFLIIFKKIKLKYILFKKKYKMFRLKLSPITDKEKESILNNYKELLDLEQKNMKNKKEHDNNWTDFLNKEKKLNKEERIIKKTNKNYKSNRVKNYKYKKFIKLYKTFYKTVQNRNVYTITGRLILFIDKKNNNTGLKMVLNTIRIFFLTGELMFFATKYFINKILFFKWKPLNIRQPYFKFILNNYSSKNKKTNKSKYKKKTVNKYKTKNKTKQNKTKKNKTKKIYKTQKFRSKYA